MACCGSRTTFAGESKAGDLRPLPGHVSDIAEPTPAPVATFTGGKSFTGTRRPEIREDGEAVVRQVRLKPFACDTTLVTNRRFAAFVSDTGYRTEAERIGWGVVFRGLLSDPDAVAPSRSSTPWWVMIDGACWHTPEGEGTALAGREDHPVVHVSYADARAYADWAGGHLPSEAEWEHAARGGLDDPRFPWGEDEPDDTDFQPCNIWQGTFPTDNSARDGYVGTSPVNAFAPNGAGIHDMAGNVWEWTAEPFRIRSPSRTAKARNAAAQTQNLRLMKGGSFLCHISYCYRYRIAARSAVAADSGASNTGFRVFYDRS
ncbi:formylglycine-generating enzyme family protein [Pelagovum pacificum]|uniref:Formylglycine-generating enzyme family protein n=1 Tax=Pelagovum pacificum TaxID=2588711 RepID=A0A5C5GLJ7_9RHOB|nr:formylglycine-generating enzyme family protein [Pelagovum pacificum]QQA42643.1 formylglycine-generating enzyme family protein [Pelagovum pacificum]TNY34206.1 formylglycine-generating enzyme family protein [Pelagovum pacificum]